MKTKITMVLAAVLAIAMLSCNADYKKTKSGLVYKIIRGGSKDSLAGKDNVLKFHFIRKLNDSLLYTSYGKMPAFQQWTDDPGIIYSPLEVLFQRRKGDSAVGIEMADTMIKKGMQSQMPFIKKGDQIKTYIKILEIFRVDSLARKDFNAEVEKDKPRQEKEMKEAEAKQKEKEEKEMQAYFTAKKITPVKAPEGTYVVINEKGNGVPAEKGKFITVKYSGKGLADDKVFDAGVYIFRLGNDNVIQGWHDGIALFNKGGKGILYVPGSLAYGPQQGPGGPYAALIFDVEILNVSDTKEKAEADKRIVDSLAAKKLPKTN